MYIISVEKTFSMIFVQSRDLEIPQTSVNATIQSIIKLIYKKLEAAKSHPQFQDQQNSLFSLFSHWQEKMMIWGNFEKLANDGPTFSK